MPRVCDVESCVRNCTWNYLNCKYHKCHNCGAGSVVKNTDYCSSCSMYNPDFCEPRICKKRFCSSLSDNGVYCKKHGCPDCSKKTHKGDCKIRQCKAQGCSKMGSDNGFCDTHSCKDESCQNYDPGIHHFCDAHICNRKHCLTKSEYGESYCNKCIKKCIDDYTLIATIALHENCHGCSASVGIISEHRCGAQNCDDHIIKNNRCMQHICKKCHDHALSNRACMECRCKYPMPADYYCHEVKSDGYECCLDHACIKPECNQMKTCGYACDDHKCDYITCGMVRCANNIYCIDHTCSVCHIFRENREPCEEHICEVDDCKRIKHDDKLLCELHACLFPGCQKTKDEYSIKEFCDIHLCSADDECDKPVELNRIYCLDHRCSVSCCREKKQSELSACMFHTCRYDDCNSEVSTHGVFGCYDHKCDMFGCFECKEKDNGFCVEHSKLFEYKFGKYQTKSLPTNEVEQFILGDVICLC
jgi:hypothetical protein